MIEQDRKVVPGVLFPSRPARVFRAFSAAWFLCPVFSPGRSLRIFSQTRLNFTSSLETCLLLYFAFCSPRRGRNGRAPDQKSNNRATLRIGEGINNSRNASMPSKKHRIGADFSSARIDEGDHIRLLFPAFRFSFNR